MKLLLHQNLSPFLVKKLSDLFPESVHVSQIKLERESDPVVWADAKENGYTIVSKDGDFHQWSFLYGHPPKLIWIKKGNCSTAVIESVMRGHLIEIKHFIEDRDASFLILE